MSTPKTLKDLIVQARAEGKWLFVNYQNIWFSPSELEKANSRGRFRWGVENFNLRDPQELLQDAIEGVNAANRRLAKVRERIEGRERRG